MGIEKKKALDKKLRLMLGQSLEEKSVKPKKIGRAYPISTIRRRKGCPDQCIPF